MTTLNPLLITSGVSLTTAIYAAFAERRRTRRRNLDKVGLVPWNLVQVLAAMVTLASFALALKT